MTPTKENQLGDEEFIERILCIGLPYMNNDWSRFPDDQEHMIAGFKHTEGFKEAKALLLARIMEARKDAEQRVFEQAEAAHAKQLKKIEEIHKQEIAEVKVKILEKVLIPLEQFETPKSQEAKAIGTANNVLSELEALTTQDTEDEGLK